MPKLANLSGQRFGMLTVIGLAGRRNRRSLWKCLCDCGNTHETTVSLLMRKHAKSCGCLRKNRQLTHGHARRGVKSPEYTAWTGMLRRCFSPRSSEYANYGGRGITVCDAWRKDFSAFLAHVGPRPKGAEIDRTNNERGYEPGNVRWVSKKRNNRNTRRTVLLTINGVTKPSADWAEKNGLTPHTVAARLRKGCSPEQAIAPPMPRIERGRLAQQMRKSRAEELLR